MNSDLEKIRQFQFKRAGCVTSVPLTVDQIMVLPGSSNKPSHGKKNSEIWWSKKHVGRTAPEGHRPASARCGNVPQSVSGMVSDSPGGGQGGKEGKYKVMPIVLMKEIRLTS